MSDALAMLELDSVASGLKVLDVMVKRSPVEILEANLVEPGKFLILYAGGVAEVEESHQVAIETAGEAMLGQLLLPYAHPHLLAGIKGQEERLQADDYDCLGVVETKLVTGALHACDRALKEALVTLTGIRIHGGLGGRAYFVLHGAQHDIEAAIEVAKDSASAYGGTHRLEIIPRPHYDMVGWLLRPYPFSPRS